MIWFILVYFGLFWCHITTIWLRTAWRVLNEAGIVQDADRLSSEAVDRQILRDPEILICGCFWI